MQDLWSRCCQDKNIERLFDYWKNNQTIHIYGLGGHLKSIIPAIAYSKEPRQVVVLSYDSKTASSWQREIALWLPTEVVLEFPPDYGAVINNAYARGREWLNKRLEVLTRLAAGEQTVLISASIEAALAAAPAMADLCSERIRLKAGINIDSSQLLEKLIAMGYQRVVQVEERGQFSQRGGIIDIFPVNSDWPMRLELFGDEIDSLREFNPWDQLSVAMLTGWVEVLPLTAGRKELSADLFDYLSAGAMLIIDEPARVREFLSGNSDTGRWQNFIRRLSEFTNRGIAVVGISMLDQDFTDWAGEKIAINGRLVDPYHRQLERLSADICRWQEKGYKVFIAVGDQSRVKALNKSLVDEGWQVAISDGWLTVIEAILPGGFELADAGLAVVSELELYGRYKSRRLNLRRHNQFDVFRELKVGDYVVHVTHGIGIYDGVHTIEDNGLHRDYFLLRYAANDKLYLPTNQVGALQRYIGSEGSAPRLSRLGSGDWHKVRQKAQVSAKKLAKELVDIYARRQLTPGYAFSPDNVWQIELEENFVYEETPDQLTAMSEIKADMENSRPMDRLVCGDVGFGKTEVALRAVFKAVMDGKQAAVLSPTTVLAEQHYQTFGQRFAAFGVNVRVLNRFRSPSEQREAMAGAADGRVDVLIGTHRLLNKKLKFKDLGLLIVDEEQRFGVIQKEKLKRWQAGVDVLTLSATPIPRTLHMSLTGARDISVIETPPENRLPVQTWVIEYKESVIAEVIIREVSRGGQVYFLYNRVETIDKMLMSLQAMLPEMRIRIAHGQMSDDALEEVMYDFYQGQVDVLLCTVLIENGLDVANANTLIVYDADRFGLAQMYQLKGRVGRSHRLAYAYFTYRRGKVLTETAEKRLRALQEFTELGSGFKVSMRDLELRGAGNLLGPEQHGHLVNVGFEMYCRLLNREMRRLKGEADMSIDEEAMGRGALIDIKVDAYIPDDYISNAGLKLEIYKTIATAADAEELKSVAGNILDRFGELPRETELLLAIADLRISLPGLGFAKAIQYGGYLSLVLAGNPDSEWLARLNQLKLPFKIQLRGGVEPALRVQLKDEFLVLDVLQQFIEALRIRG